MYTCRTSALLMCDVVTALPLHAAVTIGFLPAMYTFPEGSTMFLTVEVLSGQLDRLVTLFINAVDDTAIGMQRTGLHLVLTDTPEYNVCKLMQNLRRSLVYESTVYINA